MHRPSKLLAGSSVALFAVLFSTVAFAQVSGTPATDSVQIEAGQMFEIGTDTVAENPDFSWILTKNRTFQSAQRSRFFQTRPAQTGNYMLDVSVQGRNGAQNEYKAFSIIVTEPASFGEQASSSGNTLKARLKTIPAAINGTIYLPPAGGILVMDGTLSTGQIDSYSLDLDTSVDTDGDGNATNDRDNEDTYSEQSGSPLSYFVLPKGEKRTITLSIWSSVTGEIDTDEIRVEFSVAPSSATAASEPQQASAEILIGGSENNANFSAALPESLIVGKELLYEWDFGDRSKSLLTTPTHVYKTSGTFAVSLTVRDITNGQVVFQGTNSVTIQSVPQASQSSAVSSAASTEAPAEEEKASSSLGSILTVGMIVLFLLAIAIGMYMLFMWVKNKTAGHLSATLESMEKTIVQKTKTEDATVEPLKLKKDTPTIVPASTPALAPKPEDISEREKSKTEFASKTRDNPVPASSSGPVPSWLAKASTTPATQAPSKPTPVGTPEPKTPSVTQAAPVPDWLKPTPKKETNPETVKPAPETAPKPAAPTPTPSPTLQAPNPAAAPVPTPSSPKPAPPSPAPIIPKPMPAKEEETKTETPAPKPVAPKSEGNDEPPIAFIKADSLTK